MDQANKARSLELVQSIQTNAKEVRALIEGEAANFDQSREWPSEKNFTGNDDWKWLCGDEDFGSAVSATKALFSAIQSAGPKADDNE